MLISELKLKSVPADIARNAKSDEIKHDIPQLLDPDLGPHENKEIELMLTAEKPMSLMGIEKYNKNKTKIQQAGFLTKVVPNGILVAQTNYEKEMNLAANIIQRWKNGQISNKRYHISLGKLLGYTDQQIVKFLKKVKIS